MPVSQPSQDAVHHPRQACADNVEADRDEPHARRWFIQLASCRPLASRRTSRALERAVGPDMSEVRHAEARVAQEAGELLDREPGDTIRVEDVRVRRPILADLQERPAELVKLPDDLVDQVEPPRRQHDRPFGAFAIQLEQPDAALSAVRGQVNNVVEGDLRNRFAEAPEDRAASGVEHPFHARIGRRKGVVAVEAQLVVIRIGPPDRGVYEPHVAQVGVRLQVPGGQRAVRTVRFDAPDVLAASQDDRVRERSYVCPDVDNDVVRLETFRQPVLVVRDHAGEDQLIERAGSEAPHVGHRSGGPARARPQCPI